MKPGFVFLIALCGVVPAQAADVLAPASERYAAAEVTESPSFQRHVLPLMGKLGCNGRACHGSFQGQGGFRLSLFGYDFKKDHEALFEGDSPRADLEVPVESLFLMKTTLELPHKGGKRMEKDGWEYRLFVRWLESGAAGVTDDDPRFESLEVIPSSFVFGKVGNTTQLRVIAHWTGGIQEDVTPLCRFRTNNEAIAEVDDNGLVTSMGPGDTHVVAFYDNGVAPVEVILPVSDQVGPNYPNVPTPTRVDELVVQKLRTLGVVPSDLSDDAEFLRRVSLDMTGSLPEPAEIEAFLADNSSDKRSRKIEELLERPSYAAWWTTLFCDITGNNPESLQDRTVRNDQAQQWYDWIYHRVSNNVPYDKMVEGIVTATSRKPGQSYDEFVSEMGSFFRKDDPADFTEQESMPHFWARRTLVRDPAERSLAFAYSFLGVRLQCAQCHKHPFDQWTQEDFTEFTGFFSRVQFGAAPDAQKEFAKLRKEIGKDRKKQEELIREGKSYPWSEVFVSESSGRGNRRNRPQATVAVTAKLLGAESVELEKGEDPRKSLMSWMRRKDNPYFAQALVNRVWAVYFGVGIIDPADDLNLANPPSNAPLLAYLAEQFVEHNYDLKWLHREIANSRTYQLSWKPNETNRLDTRNFSHAIPRRLPAEVAYDAVQFATASSKELETWRASAEGRAIQQMNSYRRGRNNNYALTVFGKPERLTNCDCERSNEASLLQTIYLRNDQEMLTRIQQSAWIREIERELRPNAPRGNDARFNNVEAQIDRLKQRFKQAKKAGNEEQVARFQRRLEQLEAQKEESNPQPAPKPEAAPVAGDKTDRWIREVYLKTVSRPPTESEIARCQEHLASASDTVAGMRDLLWALINTKEFIVNH